jgi:predicted N-acetyltransferase YhbS
VIGQLTSPPRADTPVLGAKLSALWDCYRDLPEIASFWKSDRALLALFGGRLTVCGAIGGAELGSFAGWLGVREIEGVAGEIPEAVGGFVRSDHPILSHTGDGCGEKPPAGELSDVYEILCAADEAFAHDCDRLAWLSDLRRRTNRGAAEAFSENGACVLVTAIANGEAVIGAVACRPESRGNRTAAALLQTACGALHAQGLRPVTVAADERLSAYYERLGFTRAGTLALLTRRDGA